jgi:hypothetical protein
MPANIDRRMAIWFRRRLLPYQSQNNVAVVRSFLISGVTRDAAGNALASCTVKLYRTDSDLMVASTVSDGSGAYSFQVPDATQFYAVAFKAGSPDVTGATDNPITGT